jgi:hypothetical protein
MKSDIGLKIVVVVYIYGTGFLLASGSVKKCVGNLLLWKLIADDVVQRNAQFLMFKVRTLDVPLVCELGSEVTKEVV